MLLDIGTCTSELRAHFFNPAFLKTWNSYTLGGQKCYNILIMMASKFFGVLQHERLAFSYSLHKGVACNNKGRGQSCEKHRSNALSSDLCYEVSMLGN